MILITWYWSCPNGNECLQVFADLRCIEMQATLAGNKRWEKSQPFIIFPKSEEEMNMDALGREGKEIQGLMRSLKDASGQYRNFSAGSLPGCEGLPWSM